MTEGLETFYPSLKKVTFSLDNLLERHRKQYKRSKKKIQNEKIYQCSVLFIEQEERMLAQIPYGMVGHHRDFLHEGFL